MCKRFGGAPSQPEAGFTFTETLVVIALITALSSAAMAFFFGRYELARRHAVVAQLAEGIRVVQALPEGNPFTWQVAAEKTLADVMDAAAPAAETPPGTYANLLPGGMHAGRTLVTGQALMADAKGAAVAIPGCDVGTIQITLYPASLSPENHLQQAEADWLKSQLEIGLPGSLIIAQEEGVFCCLPPL